MRAPEPRVRVSRCALPGLSSDLLLDSFHLRAVWPEGKLLLGVQSRDVFVSVCQRCWPSWGLPPAAWASWVPWNLIFLPPSPRGLSYGVRAFPVKRGFTQALDGVRVAWKPC